MNDNDLLRFADECPWAVTRLRRRYESLVKRHLQAKLGSKLLVDACCFLTWWALPQLCGEIEGESVAEFLLMIADCAIVDFRNLGRLAA